MRINPMVLGTAIHMTRRNGFRVDLKDDTIFVDDYPMQQSEIVTFALYLVPRYSWKTSAIWDRIKRFHPEWARELK